MKLNLTHINDKKSQLENHSLLVTNTIQSKRDLKIFMEHHVYAVWDFMSLAKTLQMYIAPANNLWLPTKRNRSSSARLINEIILAEESDVNLGGDGYISHFDLYLQAMHEIGADVRTVNQFLKEVTNLGVTSAIKNSDYPQVSMNFVKSTFDFIDTEKPHVVAAAFTFGRETVIPKMFKGLVSQLNINSLEAPRFHYYLERHIEVDGEEHGPASLQLVEELCDNDPIKIIEAEKAAITAIEHRIKLWDQLESIILK
jgi:pyrroloquinoline quinone (PQQ) biosynthesis protein C